MKEWNPAENPVGNDERQRRIRAAQQRLHLLQLPGDAGKYAFAALDSLMELLQRLRPDISEAAEETIFIYRLRGLDLCRFNAWQGGIQFILTAGSENGVVTLTVYELEVHARIDWQYLLPIFRSRIALIEAY